MMSMSLNKYAAELIGTFVLVLIGCGSAVIAGGQIGYLGIALAFGFAVLSMVYAIGGISGCHINPAITVAMLVAGKIKLKDAAGYMISQCIGAIAASAVLLVIASGNPAYSLAVNGLGQNGYGPDYLGGYSLVAALVAEVVLTMVFLLVIFGATSKGAPSGFAGLAIGISLVFIHLVSIPITGTSVNPARSLGPAVIAGGNALAQLPVFIIAPLIGAVLAALIWEYVLGKKPEKE
ncbi:aquaporin Z [Candidatus Micrarchaeota archaeon]|nr:aquaporin Z [Candidatus Micrarchaeota archaeon]